MFQYFGIILVCVFMFMYLDQYDAVIYLHSRVTSNECAVALTDPLLVCIRVRSKSSSYVLLLRENLLNEVTYTKICHYIRWCVTLSFS
ncbi:hypothetical protein E2C01_046176 [Portunus trituberculatus]|uniref:Uncharacterized protein n=1 Tax=Portunus trituberculatus TaxID=210409 RepID=A0A5B7FXR5_PORTR|nr:hypothetical protein [Portunus trituberculatus]